jgi:hypothetical protein
MLFSCLNGNSPPNSTPLEPKYPLANTLGNTRDLCAASFSGGLCDGADISLVNASRDFAATTSKMGQKAEPKKGRAHAVASSCLVGAALARRGAGRAWPSKRRKSLAEEYRESDEVRRRPRALPFLAPCVTVMLSIVRWAGCCTR